MNFLLKRLVENLKLIKTEFEKKYVNELVSLICKKNDISIDINVIGEPGYPTLALGGHPTRELGLSIAPSIKKECEEIIDKLKERSIKIDLVAVLIPDNKAQLHIILLKGNIQEINEMFSGYSIEVFGECDRKTADVYVSL